MMPFTRRMRVGWRPVLAFYERRFEIMRRLEDESLMRSFRVAENRISVRLGDASHVLAYGPESAELMVLSPTGDLDRVYNALGTVLDLLKPAGGLRPSLSLQWLDTINLPYEQARDRATEALLGEDPSVTGRDFALLTSGKLSDPEITFDLEVGVVEKGEIAPRLARTVGRVGRPAEEAPPTLWATESLPDVALFADSSWHLESPITEPSLDELRQIWDAAAEIANGVVSSVFERFNPDGGGQ